MKINCSNQKKWKLVNTLKHIYGLAEKHWLKVENCNKKTEPSLDFLASEKLNNFSDWKIYWLCKPSKCSRVSDMGSGVCELHSLQDLAIFLPGIWCL